MIIRSGRINTLSGRSGMKMNFGRSLNTVITIRSGRGWLRRRESIRSGDANLPWNEVGAKSSLWERAPAREIRDLEVSPTIWMKKWSLSLFLELSWIAGAFARLSLSKSSPGIFLSKKEIIAKFIISYNGRCPYFPAFYP